MLLSIRNLESSEGAARLRVSVKDTGIGIKKEDLNKLAISFQRLDEQKNRHIEGTGLGISIVTKLLSMMDSELKIESEYGVGSEFWFELPIGVVDPSPIGKIDPGSMSISAKPVRELRLYAPKARVLLTDDNDMNCKVAANLLTLFGITPMLCHSGAETIELMKRDDYDILFLDHMMPEMDGIETLEHLKNEGLIKDTKVIVLTANAVVGARDQYMKSGFDDYLSKPIELPELERILQDFLPSDRLEEKTEQKPRRKSERVQATVQPVEEKPQEEEEFSGKLGDLQSLGISVRDGLTYCGDDEDFYLEIIHDYIEAAPERIGKLEGFLQDENMKDYKVVVHSVKSASKTIGAMQLFEKALELEHAAADGNVDAVRADHAAVMEEYRGLAEKLEEICR